MAVTTEQVVQVLAHYMAVDEGMPLEEAIEEMRQSFGENTEAKQVMEAIANDFFELGREDAFKVVVTEQTVTALNGGLWVKALPPVTVEQVRAILGWFGFNVPPV